MSNNKQTAVEWLYLKLSTSSSEELVGNINLWFEQAKAMHKEEAEKYAEFCVMCDRNNLPPITFNDWINLDNNGHQEK